MQPERLQLSLQEGKFNTPVLHAGKGDPLLYLHGSVGQKGWAPFLDRLSEHFSVYAPLHPGYGEAPGLEHVDDVLGLTLYYLDLLEALGLESANVVGHSLGGMVAAEMAALCRHCVKKLVLVSAVGLWRDDTPTTDFLAMTPQELDLALWADPNSDAAKEAAAQPDDQKAQRVLALDRIQDLTAAGKFMWPIPDKGLRKRLYRIKSPTLVLWGEQDKLIPPAYADEFSRHIPNSHAEVLPGWGHLPMIEQPEEFARLVVNFLKP